MFALHLPRLRLQHFRRQHRHLRRFTRPQHRAPHSLHCVHHPLDGRRRRLRILPHLFRAQRAPGAVQCPKQPVPSATSSARRSDERLGAYLQAINRHVSNRPSNFWDEAPRGAVSEETNDTAEFMQKLEWELTKIGRDLVDCALLCLTLCIEGANPRFKPRVCRPLVYGA